MQILFSEHFKKQLRKLKKKYPHVKDDFLKIVDAFNPNNEISIRLERSGSPSHQVPGGLSFFVIFHFYGAKRIFYFRSSPGFWH